MDLDDGEGKTLFFFINFIIIYLTPNLLNIVKYNLFGQILSLKKNTLCHGNYASGHCARSLNFDSTLKCLVVFNSQKKIMHSLKIFFNFFIKKIDEGTPSYKSFDTLCL